MKVKIKKLVEDANIPEYKTEGSVGMDLTAYIDLGFTIIEPGEWKIIHTGISIQLGKDEYAGVYSRSGLAAKYGIFVLNAPGIIDCDYTGEILVILKNDSKVPYKILHGDRIAQLIVHKYERVEFEEVKELDVTERGEGGLGSTGK